MTPTDPSRPLSSHELHELPESVRAGRHASHVRARARCPAGEDDELPDDARHRRALTERGALTCSITTRAASEAVEREFTWFG
jgi:hypothetical protein